MKNSAALILAATTAFVVLATVVQCGKSEHFSAPLERKLAGLPAPQPNDTFKKASRIAVKRAADPDAAKIAKVPVKTTIEAMLQQVRPDDLNADISTEAYQNRRIGPFETTLWQVDATVTEIVKRSDGDYYLVIEDGKGHKSVVEVPDPELCKDSVKLAEITALRKQLEAKFHPSAQPQTLKVKARISGLGFFGFAKSRDGKPPTNGARLMPGLKIDWLN